MMEQQEWDQLSQEEKNHQLYLQQKKLLDEFLSHKAISQAQYEKSLGVLKKSFSIE